MIEDRSKQEAKTLISAAKHIVICGRCYDYVPEVFPSNCNEKPENLINSPIGMYHCPDCGAGVKHPPMCKLCIDRKHPGFDT